MNEKKPINLDVIIRLNISIASSVIVSGNRAEVLHCETPWLTSYVSSIHV